MTREYSKSDSSHPEPTLGTKKKKKRERERERNGLWLSQFPPLDQGSKSEAEKTFLYVSLALYVAVYPSTILNRPNKNFPVELKTEGELKATVITAGLKEC